MCWCGVVWEGGRKGGWIDVKGEGNKVAPAMLSTDIPYTGCSQIAMGMHSIDARPQ